MKSPKAWVPTLYFAEGLPFVATITISVLLYKSLGLSDARIALFTSLLAWPWALKPIWGPMLEMFKTKRHLVVATEFAGGVAFGLLALSLPLDARVSYSLAIFAIIAFSSATHDIAADGLYIQSLTATQQAQYVGWQGAAYNIAKIAAQGALVYLAGYLEKLLGITTAWMFVMALLGAMLVALSVYHMHMLPRDRQAAEVQTLRQAFATFVEVLKAFFRKKHIAWGMAFIILYRSAEGQLAKIVPLFLRASHADGGLGLDTSSVGIAYGTYGAAAFVVGSFCGGYFAASRGLKRSLILLCFAFNIPDLVYVFLSQTQTQNFPLVCAVIAFECFGYGFGFVGVTLFMMQEMAVGPYPMSHYAFATAAMNLGLMIPGTVSGYLSDFLGYRWFFIWVMIATIPSFLVAWLVPLTTKEQTK